MDKKLTVLLFLFFLVFTFFIGSTIFEKQVARVIKATENTKPDPEKTIMFAYPLIVNADGQSKSKIVIFVRNNKNSGLINKKVTLSTNLGQIIPLNSISDKTGKTEFLISSQTPGTATIEAVIDNDVKISSKLSILFQNQ